MPSKGIGAVLLVGLAGFCGQVARTESQVPEEARNALVSGDYSRSIEILNRAARENPRDAAIQHLLARCYFENEQYDRAIPAAETAISLEPKNSGYHELLGRAYGEKAARSGWLSGLSLAKKARKEFEAAVQLDQHNLSAMQALIEYDCSAPSIANGSEDKARLEIEKLRLLDAAEGHYATGNCRRQKKDLTTADAEFRKALALHPKSADLIYDIGDYYTKHDQPEGLQLVIAEGQRVSPSDPRQGFFRAVAFVLQEQNLSDATKILREYLASTPKRSTYPSKAMAHYWLGRIQENQNDAAAAKKEYQEALSLEPKNRFANEALKRLQHD